VTGAGATGVGAGCVSTPALVFFTGTIYFVSLQV
jgi:hypothetical protein